MFVLLREPLVTLNAEFTQSAGQHAILNINFFLLDQTFLEFIEPFRNLTN